MHGGTLRFSYQVIPDNGGSVTVINWIEPKFRVLVYRAYVPITCPPIISEVIEYTTAAPTNDGVLLTSGAAAAGPYDMIAARSPLNFDQFHMYHDKVHSGKFSSVWSQGGTNIAFTGGGHGKEHIDFKHVKVTYYSTTANSVSTNAIFFVVICDKAAALSTGYSVVFRYHWDVTFSSADVT